MPKTYYDLSELENLYDGMGGYITLRAYDDEGYEVSVITNHVGEGLWDRVDTPFGPEYQQQLGTLQFRLPDSESDIKRMLRAKLNRVRPYLVEERKRMREQRRYYESLRGEDD